MQDVFVITAIVGFVEFVKAANKGDFETAFVIVGAATIGGLCGYFGIEDLTVISGIQYGLAASGVYKGASLIGGKINKPTTTEVPSIPQI